jgi:hypothetical protein
LAQPKPTESHRGALGPQPIISRLSAFEKQQVLTDRSPDGWAYSTQFAQFSFITEAMVRQALPSDASSASRVASFMTKYNSERQRHPFTSAPSFTP